MNNRIKDSVYINIQEELIVANSSLQYYWIYMHNDETDLFILLHKEVNSTNILYNNIWISILKRRIVNNLGVFPNRTIMVQIFISV